MNKQGMRHPDAVGFHGVTLAVVIIPHLVVVEVGHSSFGPIVARRQRVPGSIHHLSSSPPPPSESLCVRACVCVSLSLSLGSSSTALLESTQNTNDGNRLRKTTATNEEAEKKKAKHHRQQPKLKQEFQTQKKNLKKTLIPNWVRP